MRRLYRSFLSETGRIEQCFNSYLRVQNVNSCSYPNSLVDGLVIRTHDAWVRFCRELIFKSASDCPVTLSGAKLPKSSGISSRSDVIPKVISALPRRLRSKPPWWEPRWGDSRECINAANDIGLANFVEISAGIGIPHSPAENLRRVRNYIAHRKPDTAQKINDVFIVYGLTPNMEVSDFLTYSVSPGLPVFIDWIKKFQVMAEVSLQ